MWANNWSQVGFWMLVCWSNNLETDEQKKKEKKKKNSKREQTQILTSLHQLGLWQFNAGQIWSFFSRVNS